MAAVVESVTTYPDMMVKMGLATPASRAFVVGSVALGAVYLAGYPKNAFNPNGTLKPIGFGGSAPDAAKPDFLYVPVGAALAGYLFT